MEDIVFYAHIAALAWSFLHVAFADHLGLLWIRGVRETLDERTLMYVHRAVFSGLIGLVVTGSILVWPAREFLLTESPAFALKMGFVAALILNSFAIGTLSRIAATKPASDLSASEAVPLVASGAISGISWLGAFIAAFFLYWS